MSQLDIFTTLKSPPVITTDHVEACRISRVYHNTTDLSGPELDKAQTKASRQVEIILKVFRDHPHASFTPYDIHYHLWQQFDRNSVRRAITDLTTAGYLVKGSKEERRISGPCGKINYTWKYKTLTP